MTGPRSAVNVTQEIKMDGGGPEMLRNGSPGRLCSCWIPGETDMTREKKNNDNQEAPAAFLKDKRKKGSNAEGTCSAGHGGHAIWSMDAVETCTGSIESQDADRRGKMPC